MRRCLFAVTMAAVMAQAAQAHHHEFGGFGFERGGFGHYGFGGMYYGGGSFNSDQLQTRFEDKFDNLMSDYNTGLADIEDFYNSDQYTNVVDGMQHLVDRYDLFLSGVERSVNRLDDILAIANDDLDYYTNLLADYQSRDDLSNDWLNRIIARLSRMQDRLTMKIDSLTEKQSTFSTNLDSYQMFSTDLSNYLSEIIAAGGGTTDGGDSMAAILAASSPMAAATTPPISATLLDDATCVEVPQAVTTGTTAPEPGAGGMIALALSMFALRRSSRLCGATR
jgi:hypothetical protein